MFTIVTYFTIGIAFSIFVEYISHINAGDYIDDNGVIPTPAEIYFSIPVFEQTKLFPGFDDRFEAKITAKQWLAENALTDFTVRNILKVSSDLVRTNREPTDDLHVEFKERSTGVLLGVLEYAEEISKNINAKITTPLRKAKSLIPGNAVSAQALLLEADCAVSDIQGEEAARYKSAIKLANAILDVRIERNQMRFASH